MRHHCTSCSREFLDDAPSHTPLERVHCVFCGKRLYEAARLLSSESEGAVPFSADFPRDNDFALGVIGATNSSFPDTLRQFRVTSASKHSGDSLAPVQSDTEGEPDRVADAAPWQLRSFWTSLGVGFAVGAVAAVGASAWQTNGDQVAAASMPSAVVTPTPSSSPAASLALPGCTSTPSASVASVKVAAVPKPVVTPVLERRFLLERARLLQRQYHLDDAERAYRQALHVAPHDSEALSGLGELALLRGTVGLADAHFREALAANADYVPARVALADLRWQAGNAEEARQAYREIVEQYAADAYPPYVVQRSVATCVPQCEERK